jgi:hypothetical protein
VKIISSFWFATIVPALFGFLIAAVCILNFEHYGWSLFIGLPLVNGFLSGFFLSFRQRVSQGQAYLAATLSVVLLGGTILLFALDGLLCLVMALPLALCLAIIAAALGLVAGLSCRRGRLSALPLVAAFLFPCLVAFDYTTRLPPAVRCVTTSVDVRAPIDRVWNGVVTFRRIADPPSGIFRWGIAYPIEARIEGSGVGAVRQCIFSTGSFVEPITDWAEPELLAFDVRTSPPPMKELSIYDDVKAPHLHGHMVSKRGQFRLVQRDGKVTLEGTTWYSHTLSPQWYWGPISDYMIHRIHERVLHHIKRTVEGS